MRSRRAQILFAMAGLMISSWATHTWGAAFHNVGIWFKKQEQKLVFTTTAQSLTASLCSSIVTVQAKNAWGSATNLGSNLTVNLSGAGGITFYSDSNCVSAVTSVTIPSGSSIASFYFVQSSTGANDLTASAAGYLAATQSETLAANGFIWSGGGGDANWNTNANWSGGTAPGSADVAVFDSTCSANCSPTITVNPNVKGVRVAAGYADAITQSPGIAITIGTKGWVHLAGTFAGGTAAIDSAGILAIAGGTWTSTTGVLSIIGANCATSTTFNFAGGVFAHAGGTVRFSGGSYGYCNGNYSIVGTAAVGFNHLKFDNDVPYSGNGSVFTAAPTLTVAGDLTIMAGGGGGTTVNSMNIDLSGNLYAFTGANTGTAVVNIVGNGAQVYSGNSTATLPRIVVNTIGTFGPDAGVTDTRMAALSILLGTFTAPTGTLNLIGKSCNTTTLFNRSGGSFVHSSGTVRFAGGSNGYCAGNYSITGTSAIDFHYLTFDNDYAYGANGSGYSATQPLNVAADLTITSAASGGTSVLNSMTVNLTGNLYGANGSGGGTGTINIIGNSTQVFTSLATDQLPNLVINTTGTFGPDTGITDMGASSISILQGTFTAPSGTTNLIGRSCVTATLFNQTAGTFVHSGGTVRLAGGSNGYCAGNYSITGTSAISFHHLKFDSVTVYGSNGSNYSATQPLNVAGDLTVTSFVASGHTTINSMTVQLSGNLSILTGANGGTASVNYVGAATQTVTQAAGGLMPTGASTVNQTAAGNVSLASDVTAATASWTVTAGAINMNGFNLTLQGLALGGTTISRQNVGPSPGVLTVSSVAYANGSFLGGTVAN